MEKGEEGELSGRDLRYDGAVLVLLVELKYIHNPHSSLPHFPSSSEYIYTTESVRFTTGYYHRS